MDSDEDVVLGKRIKLRRRKPVGAVLCVRVTRERLVELSDRAEAEDVYLSEIVRRAIDAYLHPSPAFTRSESSAISRTINGPQ